MGLKEAGWKMWLSWTLSIGGSREPIQPISPPDLKHPRSRDIRSLASRDHGPTHDGITIYKHQL
jgi:hypothetical protein